MRKYDFAKGGIPRNLYLIKRGPCSDHHLAPFHPVIICSRKQIARWEAGCTRNQVWAWEKTTNDPVTAWLLTRWEGLDIDYGAAFQVSALPDGTMTGCAHDRERAPWSLLAGAVWWSDHWLPHWLAERGVVLADDDFTQQRIHEDTEDQR